MYGYDEWTEQMLDLEIEEDEISTPWRKGRSKIVDARTGVYRILDRLFEEQADLEEQILDPSWVDNYGII